MNPKTYLKPSNPRARIPGQKKTFFFDCLGPRFRTPFCLENIEGPYGGAPILGPLFRPRERVPRCTGRRGLGHRILRPQAPSLRGLFSSFYKSDKVAAGWKWFNWTCRNVNPRKKALVINMDETSICLYQAQKGFVVSTAASWWTGKKRVAAADVNQSTKRKYISALTFICDDVEYQPLMPQIILCSDSYLTVADYDNLKTFMPGNVILVRAASSWNNGPLLAEVARLLAYILVPYHSKVSPILMLDAARQHLERRPTMAFKFYGIALALVPASMTWLLQPLDTHVFHTFKMTLRKQCDHSKLSAGLAQLPVRQIIHAIVKTLETTVMSRDHSSAFRDTGFQHGQPNVSTTVLKALGEPPLPPLGIAPPTLVEMKHVLPSNVRTNPNLLYIPHQILRSQKQLEDTTPFEVHFEETAESMRKAPERPHTWVPRKRLTTKRSLAQAAEALATGDTPAEVQESESQLWPPAPPSHPLPSHMDTGTA